MKENGLMNYNQDGFNERSIYIHNNNDKNRINKMGASNVDNSLVKMRINENKPDVKTVNTDKTFTYEEAQGKKENFVLRNYNINNFNNRGSSNNPVANALNKNRFKKF